MNHQFHGRVLTKALHHKPRCVTALAASSRPSPTRIIVRDAYLTEKSRNRLHAMREEKGLIYAKAKHENSIDRLKGTAKNPRPIERVPAGIDFDFEIVLRVFDGDVKDALVDRVKEALSFVEMDALGGSAVVDAARSSSATAETKPDPRSAPRDEILPSRRHAALGLGLTAPGRHPVQPSLLGAAVHSGGNAAQCLY